MDPRLALQNVTKICRAYQANAATHDLLRQSLAVLEGCVVFAMTVQPEDALEAVEAVALEASE